MKKILLILTVVIGLGTCLTSCKKETEKESDPKETVLLNIGCIEQFFLNENLRDEDYAYPQLEFFDLHSTYKLCWSYQVCFTVLTPFAP